MSKDRDYIKGLFDSDGISAPESLSEENMLAMLEAAEEKQAEAPAEKQPSDEKKFEKQRASWRPYIGSHSSLRYKRALRHNRPDA